MIKILARYIAKSIFNATGLVALIITGILFLMTMLGELKNIGEGDYGLTQAFYYVLLRMPNQLYQFSPLLILLGSIIALSILSSNRELAVMRASGYSVRRILFNVLTAALLLILFISVAGEWIGPNLSYRAAIHKENAENAGQAVVTAAGVWFHIDNNFIHVKHVVGRQLLEGVTRYQFDNDHRLKVAYYANKLTDQDNEWVMHDVVKTSFYEERTKSQSYAQAPWDLKINTNLLNMGLVEPSEMTLPKLIKFTRYLEQNGLQATEYEFDFWKRILQPLASLVMIFLAIPFVLGAQRSSSMGWRILIGTVAGFGFFILNAFFGELCVVYQIPAMVAALLPTLIFALFGVILSRSLITH